MSMSINGSVDAYAAQSAAQRAMEAAAARIQAANKPSIETSPAVTQVADAKADDQTSQRQVAGPAETTAARAQAIGQRFEEISAQWNEHFAGLETKARDRGNDMRAESIAELGAKVTRQLDQMSERVVSQLDGIAQRLAQRYAPAADAVAGEETAVVDENA